MEGSPVHALAHIGCVLGPGLDKWKEALGKNVFLVAFLAGPQRAGPFGPGPKGSPFGPGPNGPALWAAPKQPGPLSQAQRARPFGPGPHGRALVAEPKGPGPLGRAQSDEFNPRPRGSTPGQGFLAGPNFY